jgi:hypothetical protein
VHARDGSPLSQSSLRSRSRFGPLTPRRCVLVANNVVGPGVRTALVWVAKEEFSLGITASSASKSDSAKL